MTVDEFDAAIDDIATALRTCPNDAWEESLWQVNKTDKWIWPKPGVEPIPERTTESIQRCSAFWAVAYHCIWFLDQYSAADFHMPTAFVEARGGPEELPFPAADGAVPLPGPAMSRDVLLRSLDFGRRQLHERIGTVDMTEPVAQATPARG